ncbi:hypothetical protein ACQ86B_20915 [Mycolicibacterium aichiense]|uniref:hypothetical protein n=1 Tax=Mycolicibacterium aichiense TaxID=1799 RepID=UPI003D66932D
MTEVNARAPGRAYRVLLTQGTLYTTGTQLANVSVVLPFICAQEGYYWAAALLYPAYCVGIVGVTHWRPTFSPELATSNTWSSPPPRC